MQAVFYEGDQVISVGECTPVAPGPGEVQLKVSHCGICGTDLHIYHGVMDQRVTFPQIMGHEVSGTVAAIGEGVKGFASGRSGGRHASRPLRRLPGLRCRAQPHLPESQVPGHRHARRFPEFLDRARAHVAPSAWTTSRFPTGP